MKKYSNTRMFLEYVAILFASYFILTILWAIMAGCPYLEALRAPQQSGGFVLIYWWIPLFRMQDINDHNEEVDRQARRK